MKINVVSPSVGFNSAVERIVQYENGTPRVNSVEFGIDAETSGDLHAHLRLMKNMRLQCILRIGYCR